RQLWLDAQRRRQPLIQAHGHAAAGSNVDDRVGGRLDRRQKLHIDGRVAARLSRLRITCMQMQNGSAGLRGLNRLARNVFGRERKVRRHGRGMDGPRDGGAGDDLVIHEPSFSGLSANYTVSSGSMKNRTAYSFTKTILLSSGSWTVSMDPSRSTGRPRAWRRAAVSRRLETGKEMANAAPSVPKRTTWSDGPGSCSAMRPITPKRCKGRKPSFWV